jgi:uncharacterized protein YndB with AHSA1/START domain
MTEPVASRSFIIERVMLHSPEKIWRALTQVPLLDEWLLKSDFQPIQGHRFHFRAPVNPNWNGIVDCEVIKVEPPKRLIYSWNAKAAGLQSVVSWTLTPIPEGTILRMEQSGFRPDQNNAYYGARAGWNHFIDNLAQTLLLER